MKLAKSEVAKFEVRYNQVAMKFNERLHVHYIHAESIPARTQIQE